MGVGRCGFVYVKYGCGCGTHCDCGGECLDRTECVAICDNSLCLEHKI